MSVRSAISYRPRVPSPDPPTVLCTTKATMSYLRKLPGMKRHKRKHRRSKKCYSLDLDALQDEEPHIKTPDMLPLLQQYHIEIGSQVSDRRLSEMMLLDKLRTVGAAQTQEPVTLTALRPVEDSPPSPTLQLNSSL
ncbi:hypothetical protein J6590_061129 [Homalodisca vitripennis]|nr:hypothetical protein J6590_061129 [Homalodisca vitripennis]